MYRTTPKVTFEPTDNEVIIGGSIMGLVDHPCNIGVKDRFGRHLPLTVIHRHVKEFISYAKENADTKFFVINEGWGDFTVKDIAGLFRSASIVENIYLPDEFWDVLI